MVSALPQHQVKTKRPADEGKSRRLPHERDESEDSQESAPRDDIKQGYEDLEHGLVDTDLHGERGVDQVSSPSEQDKEAGHARMNAPRKDEAEGSSGATGRNRP